MANRIPPRTGLQSMDMLQIPTSVLNQVRTLGARFFHRFGIHCATHQIRVILISCIVITGLFYPALALYSSAQSHPPHVLDAFLAAHRVSGFYAQHDLANMWSGHENVLHVREDAVSRARCGMERTLRVERILVQSPSEDDNAGALDHDVLLSTLHLQRRIDKLLVERGIPCLTHGDTNSCFVMSPLLYWDHDESTLLADNYLFRTITTKPNISLGGIQITPEMVLAGREATETSFGYAKFLALTYFFPDTDCLTDTEHVLWRQIIKDAATQTVEAVMEYHEPSLVALEYDPPKKRITAISAFLYMAYTFFFAYVTWAMRRMDSVHSRIGLMFTALVEITVSTITSLSVCALVGFRVTLVPWELLPIVIVFVGAENMLNLVDAVGRTSITLPVKQRCAEGLARAGTSNTLKVVAYNTILGIIAVFAGGAIRQFCVFAIVVLVAHWFLAHTFFMTVLSIDIQRLELDDLLRQNASLVPAIPSAHKHASAPTTWQKLVATTQNFLGGRAMKNMSLLLLLAITATLWYTSYPTAMTSALPPVVQLPRGTAARMRDQHAAAPAWVIWKTLNPVGDPFLHLRKEMPTILTYSPDSNVYQPSEMHKTHRLRFTMRNFRLLVWIFKIICLPIAATTSLLYAILLYLLKDSELLEAQRNRPELETREEKDASLVGKMLFTSLPRAFTTDVELIAASEDGNVVASIGVQNELAIWRVDKDTRITVDVTDVLLRAASTSSTASVLTSLALGPKGEFCAVGTAAGITAVWSVKAGAVCPLPHLTMSQFSSPVVLLRFLCAKDVPVETRPPPMSRPGSPVEPPSPSIALVAVYKNGIVAKWTVGSTPTMSFVRPSRPWNVLKSVVLEAPEEDRVMVAHCASDGHVEVTQIHGSSPPVYCVIQAGNPADTVTHVDASCVEMGGSLRLIIGASTAAGVVSLWDGSTGECIYVLDEVHPDVGHLHVSPVNCETCRSCGELPLESFSLSVSAGSTVIFYRVYIPVLSRRCTCSKNQQRKITSMDNLFERRRASSSVSSLGSPSKPPRASASSAFDASQFPVSGHGVHSRRASEKDSFRRASEVISIPLSTDEQDSTLPVGPLEGSSPTYRSSLWMDVMVVPIAEATCERGTWAIWDRRIVGIRRTPRVLDKNKDKPRPCASSTKSSWPGLSTASLERWELWSFDPAVSSLASSPLSSLVDEEHGHPDAVVAAPPRLPFTRVGPLVLGTGFGIAGFGNTLGIVRVVAQE